MGVSVGVDVVLWLVQHVMSWSTTFNVCLHKKPQTVVVVVVMVVVVMEVMEVMEVEVEVMEVEVEVV